jgi:hypothetical protein
LAPSKVRGKKKKKKKKAIAALSGPRASSSRWRPRAEAPAREPGPCASRGLLYTAPELRCFLKKKPFNA